MATEGEQAVYNPPASSRAELKPISFCHFCPSRKYSQRNSAQDKKENDIDKEYLACVANDTACPNVSDCAFRAYDRWNKEMEDAYKKLLHELKKEDEKEALKQAQDAWLNYRDYTFKSYDMMFDIPGNKWCRLRHDDRIDIVRTRALQLQNYFEVLKKKGILSILEKK